MGYPGPPEYVSGLAAAAFDLLTVWFEIPERQDQIADMI